MENSETPESNLGSNELPLCVWLKGDEPYFKDFCLDAEEVMEQLGIKRSRLRQISGNELRVGRKRVERYIRPFYRPDDVEKYLSWTRATASHQKSSQMLNSAAEKLSAQSKAVLEHLSSTEQKLTQQLEANENSFKDSIKSVARTQEQLIKFLKQYGSSLLKGGNLQKEFFDKTLLPLMVQNQKAWKETQTGLSRLASINEAFLESIGIIQSDHQILIELQMKMSAFETNQNSIELKFESLVSSLEEQQPKLQLRRHQPNRKRTLRLKPMKNLKPNRPCHSRSRRRINKPF
ncbi:MAG: hypothetical protein HRU09_10870 [Oligoflexales bacterium]|nr:hypothetical protein [Oligoflexales bacterium]